jgi:hypothetical protein
MTIFDYLNDILFTKKEKSFQNVEDEGDFQPFLVNRWISMYSPELSYLINESSNKYHSVFTDKRDLFRFIKVIIPKMKRKRINYIKKVKKDTEDIQESIDLLARNLEISKKEIYNYIYDCGKTDESRGQC